MRISSVEHRRVGALERRAIEQDIVVFCAGNHLIKICDSEVMKELLFPKIGAAVVSERIDQRIGTLPHFKVQVVSSGTLLPNRSNFLCRQHVGVALQFYYRAYSFLELFSM